jgi:hypothetical protein
VRSAGAGRRSTDPVRGATRPDTARSSVVLPQPLGPMNVRNSFSPVSNDTSLNAVTGAGFASNVTVRWETFTRTV